MSLTELTSPGAVRQALEEFDRIGRTAFLKQYGFGQAREYFLEDAGRFYDSKAIVGAAFGFQHTDRGPLRAGDFSGGEATVKAKLEELGFKVVIRRGLESQSQGSTASDLDLEKAFHARMLEIYRAARAEAEYNASRFLAMVSEHGGLETARILLHASTVSDGYTALWERGRLDLTVEAVILEPQWAPLFTVTQREIAVGRLRQYGFKGAVPSL